MPCGMVAVSPVAVMERAFYPIQTGGSELRLDGIFYGKARGIGAARDVDIAGGVHAEAGEGIAHRGVDLLDPLKGGLVLSECEGNDCSGC
jgi:hypothetical protein